MKTTVTVTKTITVTSTTKWLDLAKDQLGLSDYALAPMLGVTRSQMSRYRNGHDFLSDDAAIKLAGLLGLENPAPIIASAHAERAKSDDARLFWERLAGVAASLAMCVGVVSAPSPAEARAASHSAESNASSVYYVNKRRGRRRNAMDVIRDTLTPSFSMAM